jgi:hypothetical protein
MFNLIGLMINEVEAKVEIQPAPNRKLEEEK